MKFLRTICALALTAVITCGAQKINPITQAVLNGYSSILEKNPKDFETLFERASQYQQLGMSQNALDDIKKALEYTPAKNTDMREREYTLLSSIAASLNDYDTALEAINNAIELKPGSYVNIYNKGNILLELNRPEEAYRVFSSLQSLKSRSQEAYYGMARACIRQGNYSEAENLMKEIESANQTSPLTFCRLGNLFEEMNQPENAAANYIVAIAMDNKGNSGLRELSDLSSRNYKAAAMALDYAIDKSTNKPMMLLLKGRLANQAGAYQDAELSYSRLTNMPEGKISNVYTSLAEARLALNQLPDAMEAINESITLTPSANNMTVKADIELAMQNSRGAIADAMEALRLNPNYSEAYLTAAQGYIMAGEGDEALRLLNQAIMADPENTLALLIRAYTYQELLKNAKSAQADLSRIALEEAKTAKETAIKAVALLKSGKKLDADAEIQGASEAMRDPEGLYWQAVYYAQAGDLEKAKTLADQAVYDGFLNKHLLLSSYTPWLNLSPISHLLK